MAQSKQLEACKLYKLELIKKVLDWQADLSLNISDIEFLHSLNVPRLQEMLAFYEDTLKNGKRY